MPRKKSGNFNQNDYINQYQKKAYKMYTFRINRNKYADLIDWIDSQPNKQGYIIDLIRSDMERNK